MPASLDRLLTKTVYSALEEQAAVALIGARQVGKTTLARQIRDSLGAHMIDLELESGKRLLAHPERILASFADRLVIIDEIQRAPEIFPVLRGLIDQGRSEGRGTGRFLLLGSTSMQLAHPPTVSLTGRLTTLELTPLTAIEVLSVESDLHRLWLRGGYPASYLARRDSDSIRQRKELTASYLERDLQLYTENNLRLPHETLHRLWQQLASRQGEPLNLAALAKELSVAGRTVNRYISLLEDMLLLRRLPPFQKTDTHKRLRKAPRLYIRDSGLMHEALGMDSLELALAHRCMGKSWEGWVIENLLAVTSSRVRPSFYRSSGGAEIDLVLEWPDGELWAIEIKHGTVPKPSRGFHSARADIAASRSFVVYDGEDSYPLTDDGCLAIGLLELMQQLQAGQQHLL